MSDSASHPDHGEFVVDERLAQDLAQRGVGNFRPGDRLRFEVIDGEAGHTPPPEDPFVPLGQRPGWPPSWIASGEGPEDLGERAKDVVKDIIASKHS